MTQTLTQNNRHKTPIFNRDDLHRTFAGSLKESDFDTGFPHWMANEAPYIAANHRFDYHCRQVIAARERSGIYKKYQ